MMKKIRPDLEFRRLATVDKGKRLELGFEYDSSIHEAIVVFADEETGELFFEIECGGMLVEIPAEKIRHFLNAAETEVRSENWFDKNIYSKIDRGDI